MSELKDILQEYARICNYFVETYENEIPEKRKFDLTLAVHIQKCIAETKTPLTARLIKHAFSEAYGAVQSAKSNAENRKDKSISDLLLTERKWYSLNVHKSMT